MIKIYPGFWTQIIMMLISIIGLIGYYFSFRLGKVYERKNGSQAIRNFLKLLYIGGASTCYIWIIMSFLKQPRFPGIVDIILRREVSIIGLFTSSYGLLILLFFSAWVFWATRINWRVTLSNYDYLSPKKLLTTGHYGIVRHPMVICTFFNVFGISLLLGAYYTLMFMPVYFILNDALNWIQEKYVLEVEFPDEYEQYKKTTSRILTWWLTVILIVGVIAVFANFACVRVKL